MRYSGFVRFLAVATVFAFVLIAGANNAAAAKEYIGALVMDMNGSDEVELIPLKNSGAMWDVDGDDFREHTAWVAFGDGLLAVDWNDNGEYDDHSELFTDFDALIRLDDNRDGTIDAYDAIWPHLSVWLDNNRDGYTERGEFQPIEYLRITSIGLSAQWLERVTGGNIVSRQALFTRVDETGAVAQYPIQHIKFLYDDVNSVYVGDYELNPVTIFMPKARGYGVIPSLSVAMSMDGEGHDSLLNMVQDFSEKDLPALFPGDDSIMDEVAFIMYRWARVDGADPGGRGASLRDGRMLEYLEQMMDREFRQTGAQGQANPKPGAASDLQDAFRVAQSAFYARLAVQGAGGALFEKKLDYQEWRDDFAGEVNLNHKVVTDLSALAAAMPERRMRIAFWKNILTVIEYSVDLDSLSPYDTVFLDKAITASDGMLSLEEMHFQLLPAYMVVSNFAGHQLKLR